jgi:hypothetical protein
MAEARILATTIAIAAALIIHFARPENQTVLSVLAPSCPNLNLGLS